MNLSTLAKGMLYLCLALFLSTTALAQNKVVTGKVTDSKTGSGIPSVSVLATGGSAKAGTKTADDGSFKFTVPSGTSKLVFTSVGYEKAEADVRNQSDVSVSMKATTDQLSDIVVIGYGTRKVKDATGSVVSLGEKSFNKGVIASPEELFQGRTAGVTVTPASGEPGGAININIRGTSSVTSGNGPLFVVDGIPLDGSSTNGTMSGVEGSSTPSNPLAFLNPNDIENISILKDASAAAIYGARAANGVVLITTKGGRGKGAFTFSVTTSSSKPASRYDLLGAQDFLLGVKKANIDAGTDPNTAAAAVQVIDKGANTNWQDQIFQTAISQAYNLGWGFSKKGTSLRLSGSYDDQNGIVKTSNLQRLTGRANFSQKFAQDKLKFDAIVSYSNIKKQYPPITNNAGYQGSLIGAAIAFNPTYPVYNADGTFFDPLDGNRNPVEMLNYFTDKDNTDRFLTNLSLSWYITKNLTYKVTFGYDNAKSVRTAFADPRLSPNGFGGTMTYGNLGLNNPINGNGRGTQQNRTVSSTLIEHTLNYDKTFKNNSHLTAIGGFSYQSTTNYDNNWLYWGLATPVVNATDVFNKSLGNFKNSIWWPGDSSKYETQSYFGRVEYSIKDKYYFTGTVRIDGSSKFASGNKYGTFPAFAAKWKVLNEDFAANSLGKIFSDFSLRVNYGSLGNQNIPPYSSLALQQTLTGNTTVLTNSNPNLTWETTTTTGAGLDFALFHNRLKGTFDYYHKSTNNLLFLASYPQPAASANRWVNFPGNVINTGVELGLDFQAIRRTKGSFSWDINYNMTFMHNTVTNFGSNFYQTGAVNGQGLSGAYAQAIANGQSLFEWLMPVFQGFDGNGNARYAKGAANQYVGSALPTFTAGLTNSFTYKRWNASFFFNAVKGNYIYNNTANALLLRGSLKTAHNVTYAAANAPEDPINPGSVSTRFLEKGDFIRLSNASIGYSFEIKRTSFIKSLTATLSGQNLLLITKYSGLDPEVNIDHNIGGVPSRGFDYAGYPKPRTVSLGINVGF
ncbi:TonB-dependent receptor SusC precursor [mine drainage metagenome]|uniref:TonB-dependent receptor SusC n=1 Tax=mine drainage metagenome TaxID=410659 RepID=A0A1J5T8F5_9ZZZZ